MLTKTATVLVNDKNPLNLNSTNKVKFLAFLSIYLSIVVCVQFVFILVQYNEQYSIRDFVINKGCDGRGRLDVDHKIQKRQISWDRSVTTTGTCPPGCIRRRKKKIPLYSEATTSGYVHNKWWNEDRGHVGGPGVRGPDGQPGDRGSSGSPGQMGPSGSPGSPGQRGSPGSPGQPGQRGSQGSPGQMGSHGSPGQPGQRGSQGSPGQMGSPGNAGYPGQRGIQGAQGPPGANTRQGNAYNTYELRSGRGDQGHPNEDTPRNITNPSELLREFRLYSHPECKDEVNHRALMDTLKDKGKVSFMILIDLQDNEYCIVHA